MVMPNVSLYAVEFEISYGSIYLLYMYMGFLSLARIVS